MVYVLLAIVAIAHVFMLILCRCLYGSLTLYASLLYTLHGLLMLFFFLHGWLIDAMCAPVLVSSIMHGATLVLCGTVLCMYGPMIDLYMSGPCATPTI